MGRMQGTMVPRQIVWRIAWSALPLLLLAALLLGRGSPATAGTIGILSGTVTGANGVPIARATVKVASPTLSVNTFTDAKGRFSFRLLAPDKYVVAVTKDGYTPISYPGIAVFAYQQLVLSLELTEL